MEKNLGHATAYGYAKSKGYSGTEDEFAELMADYASVGQSAAQSAERAAASATSASGSAATASQAAQTATSKASEAVTAADTATTKASEASQSASTASTAATSAGTSAQTATAKAGTATAKADAAAASETAALSAKTDAESARDAAAQSASEAAASAESIDPDEFNRKIYAAFATDTASGSIASFPDGADNIPMKDVLVHIEPVQEGSGDPSPDNVRPITGCTGAKVTRTGKNLLPSYAIGRQKTENGITATANADGSITYVGTSTGTFFGLGDSASIWVKAGTYTLSARNNTDISINIVNAVTGSFIDRVTGSDSKVITFANDKKIYYLTTILSGKTIDTTATYQLELGSTATDYEPYHADTYDITFPAEAGTVYGGALDVTKGELVVDRAIITMDGSQFIYESQKKRFYTVIPSAFTVDASNQTTYKGVICDKLRSYTWADLADASIGCAPLYGQGIAFKHPDMSTNADWKTYFTNNPTVFSYELATPITYTITPQEITSLLGTNNLWADTGDTEVEYRADAKLYITKKITEAVSAVS